MTCVSLVNTGSSLPKQCSSFRYYDRFVFFCFRKIVFRGFQGNIQLRPTHIPKISVSTLYWHVDVPEPHSVSECCITTMSHLTLTKQHLSEKELVSQALLTIHNHPIWPIAISGCSKFIISRPRRRFNTSVEAGEGKWRSACWQKTLKTVCQIGAKECNLSLESHRK